MTATTEEKEAYEVAVRLLSRREHSRIELIRKLKMRKIDATAAANLVDKLHLKGWQSDERYAEMLVRSRILRGYGPQRIQAELQQHGISSFDLEPAVAEAAGSWEAVLEQQIFKKYGHKPCQSASEKAKRVRFLQMRGFSYDLIQRSL